MALTQESLLSFLLDRGGKVKNSELLNNFRTQISCSDPTEKQHNRDVFKKLVNSVAVVKQIDGVKFVVVKKRYQDFVKEETLDASLENSFSSLNTEGFSPGAARVIYSDIENNNTCFPSNFNYYHPVQERKGDVSADTTTVKVLNISGDQGSRTRRSGAVFAVIAVKSPPRDPAPEHHRVSPTVVNNVQTVNPIFPSGNKGDPHCWKTRKTEDLVKPQNKRDDAKYSEAVPLEPLAHEWLVKCAAGLWGQIHGLLLRDTQLAQKKDFMSGFTALHWAAKEGNVEMIHKLMDVSRKRGTFVNVNSKAHGGYTPLHIAAMHGHAEVMVVLVQSYGASVNERDYHGKKAFHYLGKGVSPEVRALLGGLQQSKSREKTEDEEDREQTKGFNTISKLFQPHMGKKQKTKFAHDW